jgi:molecular chaperone DnaJ
MSYLLTLGLPFDADEEEIKKAYRRLVKSCHPDLHPNDPEARQKFENLTTAYQGLLRERGYVASDAPSFGAGSGHSPAPQGPLEFRKSVIVTLPELLTGKRFVFDEVAKQCQHCHGEGQLHSDRPIDCLDCMGRGFSQRVKGLIRVKIECIACTGSGKSHWYPCDQCGGSGNTLEGKGVVNIPPGTLPGTELHFPRQAVDSSGRVGDLYLTVTLNDKRYRLNGLHVETRMRLHLVDILVGGRFPILAPNGARVDVEVSHGSLPGSFVVIPGLGFKSGDETGDFRVQLVPAPLDITNERVKSLLAELKRH